MRVRRLVPALAFSAFTAQLAATASAAAATALPEGLRIQEGDLVFQRSRSTQSRAVALATGSKFTHMGVVLLSDAKPVVLEAVEPVKLTPLAAWIARGEEGRVVVRRLKDGDRALTPEVRERLHRIGKSWLGKHYDLQFRWDDDRLYCSELVYKLFDRAAGIRIGVLRKAKDFDLGSREVQRLRERRFGGGKRAFDPEEKVISPQSMFEDPRLVTVFEN